MTDEHQNPRPSRAWLSSELGVLSNQRRAPSNQSFVVAGVMLAISLPSMVIAWLKLRQRNLGPILDANGWAVNARARINIPFGASLTGVAKLPPGTQRDLLDPFADKKRPWKLWLLLLACAIIVVCWWQGKLDKYMPARIRSTTILRTNAPAFRPLNVER